MKKTEATSFLLDYREKHFSDDKVEEYERKKFEKAIGIRKKTISDFKKEFIFKKVEGGIQIEEYLGKDSEIVIPPLIGRTT